MNESESIRLDLEISNRLQNEHPEQFVTLVRMHLSFELDLNTDTENDPTGIEKTKSKKWKGFHKKAKSCTSNKSTSPETAKTVLTKQNIRDVKQLIQFLVQERNISQEGIFRKSGSLNRQNELKNSLTQGLPIHLEKGDFTAHDCASVLKSFLADLSEPLLTELYYPAYCQVAEFCHSKDSLKVREDRLLNAIRLLFLLLPKENNVLLKCIIDMLHETTQHEATNKMSADNLATLFTPHLICPRKLSPEALHTTAQQMSGIISFMIKTGSRLFHIPPKLATDIRAFFVERKRRKTMSPEHVLNDSITSDSVVNTVYTFVDRVKTAEAHVMNSTDTALAQLYAHIQSLPESSKKKKLIKQFNRENGHGTPLQVLMLREKNSGGSTVKGPKSISDSIKRHIFHKSITSKTPKRTTQSRVSFQTPNGSLSSVPKQRVLFQSPLSSATNSPKIMAKRCSTISSSSYSSSETTGTISSSPCTTVGRSSSGSSTASSGSEQSETRRTVEFVGLSETENYGGGKRCRMNVEIDEEPSGTEDDEDFVEQEDDDIGDEEDDSEPRDGGRTLSDNEEDRYCSVGSLSDSRSKYKSEPNLSTITHTEDHVRSSNGKEKKKSFLKNKLIKGVSMGNLKFPFGQENRSGKKSASSSLLKCCFEDNLKNAEQKSETCLGGSVVSIASPMVLSSMSPIFDKHFTAHDDEYDQKSMLSENNANLETNAWNTGYLTSTPAFSGRDSMSPITKSTQRMPKSMQESIMTPRSRKPVMVLAGMNVMEQHSTYASQGSFSSLREEDEEEATEAAIKIHQANDEADSISGSLYPMRTRKDDSQAINSNEIGLAQDSGITEPSTSVGGVANSALAHGNDEETGSLTSTFREYLLSRSVMTDSPADLSFSSQSDDFDSSADLENMSESQMSKSLLFCMNGNKPIDDCESTLVSIRKRHSEESENTLSKKQVLSIDPELDETSL
ncbi:rho GTPase-activating protein 24 [Toxorhynchites rutilus septentrionalis]|uniref:rho GTPase-activating protein 24 n=1 Tax=Toxorhynchites rutilus septentrionalis TaxID=329112 RepID=UPI00247A9184|nr:rho GTPase-activating protein 24 [Toxorhynchites rutilus septentrionalis]